MIMYIVTIFFQFNFRVRNGQFLPIIQHNVLKSRMSYLQLLSTNTSEVNITVNVSPTSYGSLRLALHVRLALEQLHQLGFSEKDIDDVKGIFADTNLYLLSATILIASCHVSIFMANNKMYSLTPYLSGNTQLSFTDH